MPHALTLHATPLALCRLAPDAPVPAWAWAGAFASVTRTPAELSIVCDETHVPADVAASRGWRAFEVRGPLDLSLVGVLAELAAPLVQAGVSIFPIATYDTDWILVREAQLDAACDAFTRAGFLLHGAAR